MNTEQYSMSFTAGALFHQESVSVAELYLKQGDWNKVRDEAIARNLLQARTTNSARRICREICPRLQQLNKDELAVLGAGDHQEQAYLLWLAVCRRYRFIYDFSVEVIRERLLTLRYELSYDDYDAFFNAKMEWHEELESITATTRNKLRQVMFKMLREAALLNTDNAIVPALLSARLMNVISSHRQQDLRVFPISEIQSRRCAV